MLPADWVEKLFRKLSATYGQSFLRQYDGVPIEDVKVNWGVELGCFEGNGPAIARGLELLPADRAPTVLQFRDLCKTNTPSEFLALPAPTAPPVSPEVVAATKAAFKRTAATVGNRDWAHALKAREALGKGLTMFQRSAWRTALREDLAPEAA